MTLDLNLAKHPAVTLVIPTHNRAESLGRTLEAVEYIEVPVGLILEVLVVLDGCSDNSEAVVASAQAASIHRIVKITAEGLGAGGARNRGIQQSSADLIGFIDDDVIPGPLWLKKHIAQHAQLDFPTVTIGAMSLPSFMRLPPWNEWEVLSLGSRYSELSNGQCQAGPTDLYTANAMVPRKALMAVGGFNETLTRAEDVELAERLADYGAQFKFLSDVTVAHCPIRSLEDWKKIPVNYARSHIEMWKSGPDKNFKDIGAPRIENMHVLTRLAVTLFSNWSFSSEWYCLLAQSIGRIAHSVRLQSVSYAAFSSVYNVLYFSTMHRLHKNSSISKDE